MPHPFSSMKMLVVPVLLAAAAAGCESAPPARTSADAGEAARHVDRQAAIESARRDAALRFRELWVSGVDAQRMGAYWIVELHGANGGGLRYAISSQDGSIRQRSAFQ